MSAYYSQSRPKLPGTTQQQHRQPYSQQHSYSQQTVDPNASYDRHSNERYPQRQTNYRERSPGGYNDYGSTPQYDRNDFYSTQSYTRSQQIQQPSRGSYSTQYSGPPPPDPYSRSRLNFSSYRPPEQYTASAHISRSYPPPAPVQNSFPAPTAAYANYRFNDSRPDQQYNHNRRSMSPERRQYAQTDYHPPPPPTEGYCAPDPLLNRPTVLPPPTRPAAMQPAKQAMVTKASDTEKSESALQSLTPTVQASTDVPKTYAPLTYSIPGSGKDARSVERGNENNMPVYALRPPVVADPPLGATFLDSEAILSSAPRKCVNGEQKLRDPALDIVERSAKNKKLPPKLRLNARDPLDGVPLSPAVANTGGHTPGGGREKTKGKRKGKNKGKKGAKEDSLSVENILKRGYESDNSDEPGSAKKPHIESRTVQDEPQILGPKGGLLSDKSSTSDDSTAQNLLQIVEHTLAQIRSGQQKSKDLAN
ncbi:hypothetical protein V1512DRAFT_58958 [Lipomyces arxii]|uniref:uncharacterized protein n=1 Tax=Lipomyces arxii TaxID=56418 RepID=UPI0034CEA375